MHYLKTNYILFEIKKIIAVCIVGARLKYHFR